MIRACETSDVVDARRAGIRRVDPDGSETWIVEGGELGADVDAIRISVTSADGTVFEETLARPDDGGWRRVEGLVRLVKWWHPDDAPRTQPDGSAVDGDDGYGPDGVPPVDDGGAP